MSAPASEGVNQPSGWSRRRLRDVTVQIQDGTHFSPKPGGYAYKYVTSRNIGPGYLKLDSVETISSEEHRKIFRRCNVRFGDLLLTKDGANTGNAAISTFREEVSLLSSVAFIRTDRRCALEQYLLQYLLSEPGRKQIADAMAGNAITRLTLSAINDLAVPLPSVEEQRVIAAALAALDDQVGALRDLIAKAQDVKAAMMQRLLTGDVRLPDFDGPWTERPLGEIARVTMGQSPPSASYNAAHRGLPLLQGNADIRDRRSIARLWTTAPAKTCASGAVLLTVRAPVGFVGVASSAACLGRGVCALEAHGSNGYLLHALVHAERGWAALEQGSTFMAVNSGQIRGFRIALPEAVVEQEAIARVLDDADAEIAALRARLRKATDVKQGMVQELLSGRTRLPVEAEAAV